MVKKTSHEIDRAIQTAVNDVPVDHVTNWCEHIRARQVTVSFLGQMMGLPIGPKEVSCSEVDARSQAMTYRASAESFISSNCVGCPYHKLVTVPNIGEEIVARPRSQRTATEIVAEGRTQMRKLVVPGMDVEAVLATDVETDAQVKTLVGLLTDESHKADAANKLLAVAKGFPHLISEAVAEVMTGAFLDVQVGATVMEATYALLDNAPSIWPRVIEAAQAALSSFVNVDKAAETLARAMAEHRLEPKAELANLLVENLDPPVDPFPHLFGRRSLRRSSVDNAFQRVSKANYDLAAEAVRKALLSDETPYRSRGAAGVLRLLTIDANRAALEFLDPIITGISFLDEEGDVDASLVKALASCVQAKSLEVSRHLFKRIREVDPEVGELILRAFVRWHDDEVGDAPWLPQFISLITDQTLSLELRSHLSEDIEMLARSHPMTLKAHTNVILGTLAQACLEVDTIRATRPKDDDVITPQAFWEYQGRSAQASGLVSRLRQTIALISEIDADNVIAILTEVLSSVDTTTAATFKCSVIRTLGQIGKSARTDAPKIVPVIYPHLVDPESPHVRAAAAAAFEDLVTWNRDLLPDDVLLVLVNLLSDEWLHPVVSSAVTVFERSKVGDSALARRIILQLGLLHHFYWDDETQSSLIKSIARCVRNLAGQHDDLVPVAASLLNRMSINKYYYTAADVLKEFGWFIRSRRQYQSYYLERLLEYYQRFGLSISLRGASTIHGNDDDSEFETLYSLDPAIIRDLAQRISKFALDSKSDRNALHVASLLLTVGSNVEAADVFMALADFIPPERGTEWRRERSRGLANAVRAEVALASGNIDAAEDLLRAAQDHFNKGRHPARPLPFGLGESKGEPPFYAQWVDLRLRWLNISKARREDLSAKAQELADQSQRLREQLVLRREKQILTLATETLNGIWFLARWLVSVRDGDPNSGAARDAAIARLSSAKEAAELLEQGGTANNLAIQMEQQLGNVPRLMPGSGIQLIVNSLARLPIPFPRYELPAPSEHAGWDSGSPWKRDEEVADDSTSPVVGEAFIEIDGAEPSEVSILMAGQLYDACVQVRLAGPPSGATHLDISTVSSLSGDSYQFPRGPVALSPGKDRCELSGHMRFPYAQSEGSQPIAVKLMASLITEAGTRIPVSLFGRREMRVRVYRDASGFRVRGPAAQDVADKLRSDIVGLVPAQQDPNRADELDVAVALANYMDYQLKESFFRGNESEAEFEGNLIQYLRIRFQERDDVYRQVWSGSGRIDGLALGIPLELKVFKEGDLDSFVSASLPQVTQYVVTQGRRVGFLAILDLAQHPGPTPPIIDDISVRRGLTERGLEDSPQGVIAIAICIVRGHHSPPSALKAPR